jgi:hypothetical protein
MLRAQPSGGFCQFMNCITRSRSSSGFLAPWRKFKEHLLDLYNVSCSGFGPGVNRWVNCEDIWAANDWVVRWLLLCIICLHRQSEEDSYNQHMVWPP